MNYNKLLHQLYQVQLFHPVKNGLQNMKVLSNIVNCNLYGIPVLHVAGTNGKGTVCLKIAETLRHAGYKTALYTSPHVSSFRERVQINGALINEVDVEEGLNTIFATCETHAIPATFFEITTALAFRHFARQEVDVAVVEVGLGGRLDATNILDPTLSIITSIQLDHTKILGDTIEAIAVEKAGIMKAHRPVLISDACPTAQLQAIAASRLSPCFLVDDVLSEHGVPVTVTQRNTPVDTDHSSTDISHAALLLLRQFLPKPIPKSAISTGLSATLPCRFEEISVSTENGPVICILDIAHNIAAMTSLTQRIRHKYPKYTYRVVFGMSADKDVAACADIVASLAESDRIHCVAAKHSRALSVPELQELFRNSHVRQADSIEKSIRNAVQLAGSSTHQELVVVCGSVFIMSEARKALGISEPCDNVAFDTKYYNNTKKS